MRFNAPMMNCGGSWVEVDLAQLGANAASIRNALGGADLMAVVKADAYGHGLAATASALRRANVKKFAVAYVAEAMVVRQAIPDAELILVLGVASPQDVAQLLAQRITPVVVSVEHGCDLAAAATAMDGRLPVHLKLDTGMGRLGFVCPQEVDAATRLCRLSGLDVRGVCTHFAMVELQRKPEASRGQVDKFLAALPVLEEAVGHRLTRHMSSTRGALLLPECDQDFVRVGIALYGYGASDATQRFATRPILQWKARVMQVKKVPADFAVGYYGSYRTTTATEVATISCGYTDGYQRHLGNHGHVLIGGERRRVVGRVSMNWITVDLGPDSGVRPGDEVTLIGEQDGAAIWADELAIHCETIAYEILTGISRQIERRYHGGAAE